MRLPYSKNKLVFWEPHHKLLNLRCKNPRFPPHNKVYYFNITHIL